MRTRSHRVVVCLNDEEYSELQSKVKKSGLPREAFLRRIYRDGYVKEAPPTEYAKLLTALSRIGMNMNQIAATLNSVNYIDASYLNLVLDEHRRTLRELQRSWKVPSKEEREWHAFMNNLKERIVKQLKAQGCDCTIQDTEEWLTSVVELHINPKIQRKP